MNEVAANSEGKTLWMFSDASRDELTRKMENVLAPGLFVMMLMLVMFSLKAQYLLVLYHLCILEKLELNLMESSRFKFNNNKIVTFFKM